LNTSTSKPKNNITKAKKSLVRIKSNHFYQKLGNEMKSFASNNSQAKKSERKRRNGNCSTSNLRSQNRNANKSYYTHRDKELSKRSTNKMLSEINEERCPRTEHNTAESRRH